MDKKTFGSFVASGLASIVFTSAAMAQGAANKGKSTGAEKKGQHKAESWYCKNNACSGKSECTGHGNDKCKGQNSCADKGWLDAKDEADCKKLGGVWSKDEKKD